MKMVLLGALVVGLFFNSLVSALDAPIVYQDWKTGRCVAIEDPQGLRPCGQLPERYDAQPVQPGLTFAQLRDSRQK
jgi:hypothetical protein